MPTYEYKREDGTIFEYIQGMNDEPLKTCPDTGQPVKRIISGGGGVVYKGTGWYVTDYKNNGSSNGNDKENGTAKTESSSGIESKAATETKAEGSGSDGSAAGTAKTQ
jgi:putative FmdB family regulatory protein